MALGLGATLTFQAALGQAADFPGYILPESTTIYFQRADQLIFIPNLLQTPVNRSLARRPYFHKASLLVPDYDSRLSISYDQAEDGMVSDFYGNDLPALDIIFFRPRRNQRLKIAGDYQLGRFYVSSEFTWDLAELEQSGQDSDENSYTFKFDAGHNYGNLQTGLMYYYASADDGSLNLLNSGNSPAYILNNSSGIMEADRGNTAALIRNDGVHAIVLHSDLALSSRLNLHGGLAYGISATDPKNSYGMEVDIGASYAIFDNLIYKVRLGYLNAGNFEQYDNHSNPEDMYLLTHHLTLEF